MNRYILAKIACVVISALSQIILKKSADKKYDNVLLEYLNPAVIISYVIFFGCVLMDTYSLKGISLAFNSIIDSFSYILIPLFSYLLLNEKLSRLQILGIAIIFCGFLIYSI